MCFEQFIPIFKFTEAAHQARRKARQAEHHSLLAFRFLGEFTY